ncbi:MAG TPA: MFS transporter [Caulobacteraceae bacterium]|nr:MFS transporter [Caulobacteraceae bacterium]
MSETLPERQRFMAGALAPMIIGCALFMQTLDSTVISNALPTMARSLHEDPVTLNLAITAYLLAAAVFLPISGWAADRFGAKNVFRIAIVGFAASSLCCGLSHNLFELVAARVVQGMAGAMMAPVGRLVLLKSVPKSELVRAMSYLTMPAMLGPVLGPPVGGFIVTYFSWRWIFFINIPVAILGVILVTIFIENVREEHVLKLDWRGFVLSGFGLAGIVYGFENLGRGMMPITALGGLLVGGAVCLVIYWWHARRTPHAILDLTLFRMPSFMTSTIGGTPLRMAMGSTPFLLALLLQLGFGMSALEAGLITFTSAAGALLMKTTARPIIAWFGFKNVLVWNTIISGVIFMGYGFFTIGTPHWLIIATLLVGGFFRSLQFTALNTLAYADVDQPRMSRASSLASMVQQLSQSLGIGFAALLLSLLRHGHESLHTLKASEVTPTFFIIGAVSLLGLFFFAPLPHDIGAEVSGRRSRQTEPGPLSLGALTPVKD